VLFFVLAFGMAWSIWFVMRAAAIQPILGPNFSTSPGYLLLMVGAAGPTWAALLVSSLAPGHADRSALARRLLRWRVGVGWYLIALGLPLLLALMTAVCYTLAGGLGFAGLQVGPLVGLAPQLLWTLVLGGPLEEELGWRGFAFPLLRAKTNAVVSSLIIGVLWGLWHLPLFLLPGTSQYVLVTQHPLGILWFVGFVVQTTALSVLFGWLVTRTNESVPIAMVFHTAANTAYSVLAILGVYAAWQALLCYVGLLVLTAVIVIMTNEPHLTGSFSRSSSAESHEAQASSE
jgi:membrane protease YdiL (CAAX protease family)